jgi:thiol:disulfide interchange protein
MLCAAIIIVLCGIIALCGALPRPAQAQIAAPTTHIRAGLDAESSSPAAGSTSAIALSMVPDTGWHGYWKNGGDAGFGMRINWDLPPGVMVGEIDYPVPDTLVIAGLMNHVYERPYALIAPMRVAAGVPVGTRLPIRGTANWLACTDQICVPERGDVAIDLVVGDGAVEPEQRQRFDGWRAALPQPLGQDATFVLTRGILRIGIPWPAATPISAPHLFVATTRANQAAADQSFTRKGDLLIIETSPGADAATLEEMDALLRIGTDRGLAIHAVRGAVPPPGEPLVDAGEPGSFDSALFLTALAGAIIGGLILNIMPCVFPILSLKALALARAGAQQEGGAPDHVRAEGFAYTAGAVLTCLMLGIILLLLRSGGEAVGWAFQLQRPESVVLLIVLMAAMTANLAGLFEFTGFSLGRMGRTPPAPVLGEGQTNLPLMPASGQGAINPPLMPASGEGAIKNAFATGALAAFVATPCSGPFLGAALGATLVLPVWAALPIFGGLGLGLALPFLALSLFPALRRRLPRPGPWMLTMRRVLAVPMALTALALIWLLSRQVGMIGWAVGGAAALAVVALGWWGGRLQAEGETAGKALFAMAALIVPLSLLLPQSAPGGEQQAEAGVLNAEPWSAARLATVRASGRPVFVYFTADWCVSCKVNEASSIERDETATAFRNAGVRVLRGDWTSADPAITRELAVHGRNSVPLYLWYPAGGGSPEILPQVLTPSMLSGRAHAATAE